MDHSSYWVEKRRGREPGTKIEAERLVSQLIIMEARQEGGWHQSSRCEGDGCEGRMIHEQRHRLVIGTVSPQRDIIKYDGILNPKTHHYSVGGSNGRPSSVITSQSQRQD